MLSKQPRLLNSAPCYAYWQGRLPGLIEVLKYDDATQYFKVERVVINSDRYLVIGTDAPLEDFKIPEAAEFVSIATDITDKYAVCYMLDGRGVLHYYNDLEAVWKTREIECTSCSLALSTAYPSTIVPTEILLHYTVYDGTSTSTMVSSSLSRFSEDEEYDNRGRNNLIRVTGITENNRFLVRFFDRIEIVP